MRYRSSFVVAAPPDVVFDYLADGANSLSEYPPGTEVVRDPPGPISIGTSFTFTRRDEVELRCLISRFERPSDLEFENTFRDQGTRATWTFRPEGLGTRLMSVALRS